MTGNLDHLTNIKRTNGGFVKLAGNTGGYITKEGVLSNDIISFKHKLGVMIPEDWIVVTVPTHNNTYQLDMSSTSSSSQITRFFSKATKKDSISWHRQMGHVHLRKMNFLIRNGLVEGVPSQSFVICDHCISCKKGKHRRQSHKPKVENSINIPLTMLRMDLCGPVSVKSARGRSFSLVDISHQFSAPYTSQQNGVAERKNRTLIETARTILADSHLPITFWAKAVNTACYTLNHVLTVKKHGKTSYQLLKVRKPNLAHLKPFGAMCTYLKLTTPKFEPKAVDGIFLGYSCNFLDKRVLNLANRVIEEAYEVTVCRFTKILHGKGLEWLFDYESVFHCFHKLFSSPSNDIAESLSDTINIHGSLFPRFILESSEGSSSVIHDDSSSFAPEQVEVSEESHSDDKFHGSINDPSIIIESEIQGEMLPEEDNHITNLEDEIVVE
ncbi:hypothetical protein E3N88_07178 [Mikania micrantha]|uniref:Integrase catalytic domain-containing protein n=1 Tax=Mikania micrantha TaxID=192012 RepID=A0A5N6PRU7_9ASTR|nr:hypothetical protein E3N88_07178 [Mikania micrantha]